VTAGPTDTAVPRGTVIALDRRARSLDDGAVLLGGAPPRLLHLAPTARAHLADGRLTVSDATSAALARRLLDAGIAHMVVVPASPSASEVTVVVPVKDRLVGLRRLLDALPSGLGGLVVVDDGSADTDAVRALVAGARGRMLRHPTPRGPAAARNAGLGVADTPLVAFLDSDVVPEPGWLAPLLAACADPAVGLVAPRIVGLPVSGWLGQYEAVRSSLDLGPDPALVVPRSRVAYVPSAALLARRAAVGTGFDEALHVAEDVDLVLRLHEAGWRVRYEPGARVAHEHRTTLRAWWVRKAFYGTGAAPLALRHRGAVPPLVLSPSAATIAALLLLARPRALLAAIAVGAVASERLARRLDRVRRPRRTAAWLIGLGALGAARQAADAVTRHYWPLSVTLSIVSRRARRTVAAIAVADGVLDWLRYRRRDDSARPGLASYILARRLDDLAYGAGLWWGAARHRTLAPLVPTALKIDPASRAVRR